MTTAGKMLISALALGLLCCTPVRAAPQYDTGASDTEIKIGQTYPYSGPASMFSTGAKAELAYFRMINERGGVNGRRINLISLDDAYSPPKTVEQTRKLVEQDEVLFIFNSLGTATNAATQRYLNAKKVPQLFVATGASKIGDPKTYPWTMGWLPSYRSEAFIYARYVLATVKDAKIGVLYQNDDLGKDYLAGFRAGLGEAADRLIVKQVPYEVAEPTIESELTILWASGANVLLNVSSPKFAAQAIRKAGASDWKPLHILTNISNSVAGVLKPSGLDNATGLISARYQKDPADPEWADDDGMREFQRFMRQYYPESDPQDLFNVYGYNVAQAIVEVLRRCGDDLTRANLLRQATNLDGLQLGMVIPGIKVTTSPTDYKPIEDMQLIRFNGKSWEGFGDIQSGAN
ncbi:ABC transporter substrate-binding protein [Bradyrhizobium sp. UFLA 03-164]|uniref:ABC transporter substrate-binding protein n=2 Tax=Bradyrhizobium uaiense TaxID=2594946 RepID=A0A6P1BJ48_9BRAD|nr:ABC transporter substrate-binding protein [Bradyrhizobium uaiense]NEU98293.1 ABC transporter substrate-binding protein [Bradyrhizobium uaiense]